MGNRLFRSWFPTAIAVLAGLTLGLVLGRSERQGDTDFFVKQRGNTRSVVQAGHGEGGDPRKRPRPVGNEEIGLSPKQWRMLQDKPSLLNIDLGQCLSWKGIREVPIEDVKGFGPLGMSIEESGDGPDLTSIVGFFGLGEKQTALLGDSLKRFGERIRNVEAETEQVEYRGDGTMLFSFPGGEHERRAAFDDLERALYDALGAQDAGRLWELSSLAKASAGAAGGIEASISISGRWVTAGIPNENEIIFSQANGMNSQIGSLDPDRGFGGNGLMRMRHLEHRVDWMRLYSEAEKRAKP